MPANLNFTVSRSRISLTLRRATPSVDDIQAGTCKALGSGCNRESTGQTPFRERGRKRAVTRSRPIAKRRKDDRKMSPPRKSQTTTRIGGVESSYEHNKNKKRYLKKRERETPGAHPASSARSRLRPMASETSVGLQARFGVKTSADYDAIQSKGEERGALRGLTQLEARPTREVRSRINRHLRSVPDDVSFCEDHCVRLRKMPSSLPSLAAS